MPVFLLLFHFKELDFWKYIHLYVSYLALSIKIQPKPSKLCKVNILPLEYNLASPLTAKHLPIIWPISFISSCVWYVHVYVHAYRSTHSGRYSYTCAPGNMHKKAVHNSNAPNSKNLNMHRQDMNKLWSTAVKRNEHSFTKHMELWKRVKGGEEQVQENM